MACSVVYVFFRYVAHALRIHQPDSRVRPCCCHEQAAASSNSSRDRAPLRAEHAVVLSKCPSLQVPADLARGGNDKFIFVSETTLPVRS